MLQRKTTNLINKRLLLSLVFVAFTSTGLESVHAQKNQSSNQATSKKKSSDTSLTSDDKIFLELREASKNNDPIKAKDLGQKLSNYDIADYVAYFQIKPRLFDKGGASRAETTADNSVDQFLKKYAGTALADRLRNDWLLVLGKRKDWSNFDREYAQFVLNDDTQVKCYAFQSRLAKGESASGLASEVKNTLLDSRHFGDACPELVNSIYTANGFSKYEVATFSRMAIENNFETLANRFDVPDPVADIVRSARKSPEAAFRDFDKKVWRTSKENTVAAWGSIGQYLAKRLDSNAIKAFRLQHELGHHHLLTPETQEWKVRAALRVGDWRIVKETIDHMTPAVRKRDPAWTYWHARAQNELGNESLAKEGWQALIDHYHFYGQLAREDLGMKIYVPKRVPAEEAVVKQMSSNKGFARAIRFYNMGIRFEGNREWNWELRGLSDKQLIAAAEHAKRIGLYDRAVNTADRTKLEHDFTLRYPTPFKESLAPIAGSIGLDTNWAYGLIRQESRFIMNARSHVGASGLMQVMPATGKYVAKKIGMNNFKPAQLDDMKVNLTLGSNYLNMVLLDLGGSWALASAAYNAGPSRPKMWREKLPRTVEGAIFAETIPFNETRGYVKNVLANTSYYTAMSSNKAPSLKQNLGTVSPKTSVLSELP